MSMNVVQWLGDLLLSQWIWSITFDLIHYTFSFCIMFMVLLVFTKNTLLKNLFLSLSSMLFAFAALFFIGTTVLDTICNWNYCPLSAAPLSLQKGDVMKANLLLAGFIALLQGLFFVLFSYISRHRALPYFYVALLSNFIAAFLAYGHIILTMRHLF